MHVGACHVPACPMFADDSFVTEKKRRKKKEREGESRPSGVPSQTWSGGEWTNEVPELDYHFRQVTEGGERKKGGGGEKGLNGCT